jgi:release factor glutamine methyltransferase
MKTPTLAPGVADVRSLLSWGASYLHAQGFENSEVEARALLSGLMNCSSPALLLRLDEISPEATLPLYEDLIRRRSQHEPVAYILGRKNFYGLDFLVNPDVLIPRPETELLVDESLAWLKSRGSENPAILDVGTGSGCIAISMGVRCTAASITALDISEAALAVAEKNAGLHHVMNVRFLQSNLYRSLGSGNMGYFDMILSNPPYVSTLEMGSLDPDLAFEPRLALEAGEEGLDVIREVICHASDFLRPQGILLLEVGFRQGSQVIKLFSQAGFKNVRACRDNGGFDRVITGEKIGSV